MGLRQCLTLLADGGVAFLPSAVEVEEVVNVVEGTVGGLGIELCALVGGLVYFVLLVFYGCFGCGVGTFSLCQCVLQLGCLGNFIR